MNKTYQIIWNANTQQWIVASELAGGKKKSKSSKLAKICHSLIISGSLSLTGAASADALEVAKFSPKDGGQSQVVIGVDVLTQGSGNGFADIIKGDIGYRTMTLSYALANGYITSGAEYISQDMLKFGAQTQNVSYTDPITHSQQTVATYNNNAMSISSAADFAFPNNYAIGPDGQYVDRTLYTVQQGGNLSVDVGSVDSNWMNNQANQITAIMKGSQNNAATSAVFKVATDASSVANATLDYISKTVVELGNVNNNAYNADSAGNLTPRYAAAFNAGYAGTVQNSQIGYTEPINNFDDFKNYNTALIAAVQAGKLTQTQYNTEFKKGYDTTLKQVFATAIIPDDDAMKSIVNRDRVAYIIGDGNKSIVNIATSANIHSYYSDISLVKLINGAVLNNNGTLGTFNNTLRGAYIVATTDSIVINNGVIDAGTDSEMAAFSKYTLAGSYNISTGNQTGIMANGSSVVDNNGVINSAPRQNNAESIAVNLNGTAKLTNNGAINVAALPESGAVNGEFATRGVIVQSNAQFDNKGTLYVGRMAQRATTDATTDIAVTYPNTVAVWLANNGKFTNQNGAELVIGSLAQGVTGVYANGANTVLNQLGVINVNGQAGKGTTTAPLQNIAINSANGSKNIVNNGTINLNGINGVGIKVLASSAATNSATGVININGASDRINGTANYGIWSEGAGATANLSGKVNLNGDSSVGVHVRNQGKVNVSNAGEVLFASGKNQTGYYVYGAGSSINNQTTGAQNVATEGSTLYRIDGGASFNGGSTQSLINADGKNSTALLVTGKSDTGNIASTLSTGSMKLNVNGTGATGVKVEGGANGTINAETTLILNGSQTTAGIVDGNSTSIIGTAGVVGLSTLTSLATLTSGNTASDAMGYIARNGGKLIHNGTLNFDQANSTGVLISGGTLENNSGISVNGTAVNIQGKNSKVTNTGTVAATDGTAAYLVGANASLALDGKGTTTASGTAHGILLDSGAVGLTVNDAIISVNGSGNGIENKANIAGIQLNATTLDAGSGAGVRTGASMATTNSGTINVNGKDGTGILFANTDLSMTSSILDMSKSQQLIINVAGENGIGIDSRSTGDIKTGASVNVNALNGGPALKIGGTSSSVEQSGNLVSKSTQSPVVDISSGYVTTFINSGKIQAATTSQSAVQNSANNGVAFTNDAGGVISGKVNLLSGNNTVTLMSSSQGTDFITGSGDDTFILKDITATDSALFTSLQGGAGTDSLILDNSLWTLSDATSLQQIDKIKLINNSTFTLDNTLLALGDAADDNASTGFNIESGSRLNVRNNQAVSFNNKLLGTGLVDVDTTGNAFDFTTNAASNTFTGTLALGNSRYALSGLNTQALTTATLQLNQGSYTKVGTGKQTIGGLAFNGGTIDFGNISPGDKTAVNNIHTRQNMDLSGNGVVQVTLSNMINYNPTPDTKLSLLAQDDAQTILKLADSDTTVVGSGGNLVLEDQHGTAISNKTVLGIDQDGSTVANGTWDYRLTAGDKSDGLYINYGLTEVELLGKGNQALSLSTEGATGAASDLSAHVTGSGDLLIDTGKGNTLSLSNLDNDYLGNTTVSSGTLAMHNNNVLGQTDSLTLAADAGLDMMGHSQTINTLQNELGGNLSFNDGSLTLHQGGNSDGILSGSGSLNVNAGALNINNANNTLAVTTTIANAASVLLTNVSGLGRGVIDNAGLLTLQGNTGTLLNALSNNGKVALTQSSQVALSADSSTFSGTFSLDKGTQLAANAANQLGISVIENDGVLAITANNDWQLDNDVTGSGAVTKQGDETLTVNNNARWTGATDILAGGLLLGDGIQPVTLSSQQANIAQNAFMAGNGGVAGNVNNQGTLYVGAQPNSNIVLRATSSPATFTVGGDLSNDGKIVLAGNTLGNQLIVNNNYTGNNGHLSFNTVLGGDDSLTDHLLIKGDSAGTTTVSVNNVGGTGAATLNGIELIHVNGQSDGDFIQESRIVAGAYDYVLSRGTAENSGNWYLDNFGSGSTPISYPILVDPDVTPNAAPTVRPEAGSYVSNIAAANTLFTNRLHDRLGETQYIDVLSGEKKVTSMWMRNVGGHTGWKDGSGQLNSQSNRYVMQIGGDLAQWSLDGLDRWHLGSMAGYANQHSNTQSNRSTHQSEGDISGYSIGVYGTWYANDSDKTGIYIDSWVQYNWFDNTVKGQELADESYKSKGTTASLETGYTFKTGEKPGTRYYLQPKVQATWMGVKADNHQEANGTNVSSDGNGNLMTRLGVRAFMNGHHSKDDGKDREFEPFIEANWIHNTKNFSTNMDGATVSQQGTKNIAEIKVGVEGQINKQLNTWGNVGVQVGDAGYNDTAAMIGVKYNF